ncbi:MAG TPA: hypothetical protein VHV79_10305 [Mycobacteriales bacterium]|nr:hypothetical protein [Mycobacteriales bacterium]
MAVGAVFPALSIRAKVPLDVVVDTIQPFPAFSEIYVGALGALRASIRGCLRHLVP